MDSSERFNTYETFSILAVCFLFSSFNGALSRLARACGAAGWIAMLLGFLLSLGYFQLYCLLARRHRCTNILDISRQLLGTAASKIICLLLFIYFLVFTVENLAEAANMLVENTYANFRGIAISVSILAVAGIVNLYPVKGLARTISVAIPLFFASVLLILLMNYKHYDINYLFPILGHGVQPILETGVFHLVSFDGLLLATLFFDSLQSERQFRKAGFWALVVSNCSFVLSALCYSMATPYQVGEKSQAGMMDLARAIYVNRFFQRFESIFIIFVSLGKILVVCLGVAAMLRTYNTLFSIPDNHRRKPGPAILLLTLAGGQLLLNQQAFWLSLAEFTQKANLYFALAVLGLLLLVGLLRGRKRPLQTVSALLVCCLGLGLLGGCAQVGEPDEEIFAIVLGYDRSDSETLRITMKFMPEEKSSAGGAGGGSFANQEGSAPHNVFSVDAPCNLPAADLVSSVIPKHISMLHVKMLVISEELAREDIDVLISSITRYNEIKPTVAVVICDGSAEEFITAKTSDLIPFIALETEMILKQDKGSSNYQVRTLGEIYSTYVGTAGDAMAMYGGLTMDARAKNAGSGSEVEDSQEPAGDDAEGQGGGTGQEDDTAGEGDEPPSQQGQGDSDEASGGNVPSVYYDDPDIGYLNGYLPGEVPITTAVETQIIGMAVFRDTKMVGTLNSHQTQMFMIADGSFSSAVLPVRDPEKPDFYVMYTAKSRKPSKITARVAEDGTAVIDIQAYFQISPTVVHNSSLDYQQPAQREMLKQYTTEYLEEELQALVQTLQGDYGADTLRLGRYVARSFLTVEEWEDYNWREQYEHAEINVSVDLKL